MLVIIQGHYDYVSPSSKPPASPGLDNVTSHLYGTPVLRSAEEDYAVLCQLTDHFEIYLCQLTDHFET